MSGFFASGFVAGGFVAGGFVAVFSTRFVGDLVNAGRLRARVSLRLG
jgi:hypothetical protein